MIVSRIKAAGVLAVLALVLAWHPALAQSSDQDAARIELKGLYLTADFPRFTLRLGEKSRTQISLRNYNLPPQRVDLEVTGVPEGWTWSLTGNGRPVASAMVAPNETKSVELELEAPQDAKPGTYDITVAASGPETTTNLALQVKLTQAEPAVIKLEPELPALRGSPNSTFDFRIKVSNDGPDDALINLAATAPEGFLTTIKQAYGSKEITGIPVKAGSSETISLEVRPPRSAPAGEYPVNFAAKSERASASTQVVAFVTGQPDLQMTGPEQRLSGRATAGEEASFPFTLVNTGSAPATRITLSASQPSGWKVEFDPKEIDSIAPQQTQEVNVRITPSNKAIAGDYMVTLRASGSGISESRDFRVTVTTSTLWGAVGLGVLAAAVVVLGVAVSRYGRR